MTDSHTGRTAFGGRLRALRLDADDIARWTEAVGCPGEIRAALLADLRSMRVEYATWRRQFRQGGFARLQRTQVALEAGAAAVRVFEPSIVPGLLSPDYARHVFRGLAQLPGRGRDIDEGVHARMGRQEPGDPVPAGKGLPVPGHGSSNAAPDLPTACAAHSAGTAGRDIRTTNGRPGRDPDGRGTATHVLARLLDLRDAVGSSVRCRAQLRQAGDLDDVHRINQVPLCFM